MAKAAAKKAATARKQVQDIYVPVMLGLNAFYWFLKYIRGSWLSWVGYEIFFFALFAGTHYLVYQQILNHAVNRSSRDTSLIGGQWLDVLAVLAVIQLGSAALSTRFYWLLLALPFWGAWSLYQTFMGKGGIASGKK